MADATKRENFEDQNETNKPENENSNDSLSSENKSNSDKHEETDEGLCDCQEKQGETDEELDDLLDSALEDFSKPAVVNTSEQAAKLETASNKVVTEEDAKETVSDVDGKGLTWSDEFLEQATAHFQDAVKALEEEDPKAAEDVKKFAELASKAATGEVTESDFTASLSQALKGLSDNAELLSQNPPPLSEDDFANLFSSLATEFGSDSSSIPDITLLMQNMMQNLLSKEVLYPAIHDIADKYPDWLAENRSKLETAQYEKYNSQFHIMKQVCDIFEEETENDTEEVKQNRFGKILGLMQKMQDYGQPPSDLVGEVVQGIQFDENGIPRLPGFGPGAGANSDQCKMM